MKATDIEFRLRGVWFGLIFWISFSIYWIDGRNLGSVIANDISQVTGLSDINSIHLVFGFAALIAIVATLLRTWAASYLTKDVVHDARLHAETIVADGPYRFTRNPLYLAVDLFAIGCSVMASPYGALVMVIGVIVFNYRLILREEYNMELNQAGFRDYVNQVPRLFPSFRPSLPASGRKPNLKSGIVSELTFWSFTLGIAVFAVTLNAMHFYLGCGLGIVFLIVLGKQATRKKEAQTQEVSV